MNSADRESRRGHPHGDYPDDKDEWNAAAFDRRKPDSTEWKNEKESKSKKPSRVQDIAIVDSDHHQDTDHSKQWPYEKEKSPCRIHGGKNTRPGPEADAINKEYFDPNFADKTKNSSFGTDHECDVDGEHQSIDSDDEKDDSFAGDDDDIEPVKNNPKNSKKNSTKETDRAVEAMDVDDYERGSRATVSSSGSSAPPRVQRRSSLGDCRSGGSSARNVVLNRRISLSGASSAYRRGQSSRNLTASRDDDLTAVERENRSKDDISVANARGYYRATATERQNQRKEAEEAVEHHVQATEPEERNRPSRVRSNRDRSGGLDSATSHGDKVVTTSARNLSGARQAPSSRRGAPGRTKSSDDPAVMMPGQNANASNSRRSNTSSRNDELGAATLHGTSGKSAVSRIRRSTTGDEVSSKKSSSSNSNNRSSGSGEEKIDRRSKFKRAMSTENVRRPEEYGPDGGKAAAEEPRRRGGRRNMVAPESNNKHSSGSRKKGSLHVEEKDSSSESDSEVDSDDDSFADDAEHLRNQKGSKSSKKHSSSSRGHQSGKHRSSSSEITKKDGDSRDLLELLHDNKSVKLRDMQDKDNRRILHFLIYEHKMGISLQQMKKSIRQEILEDPEEALRRVPLPLFVEPQA